MGSFHSLKVRIAATIFVLEGLMMGFTLWQVLGALQSSVANQVSVQEQVTLDLLKGPSLQALVTEEFTELQPYFESLQRDQRIVRAVLLDSGGRIVAAGNPVELGRTLEVLPHSEEAYWRSQEIGRSGVRLGTLSIEFSRVPLDQAGTAARNLGIVIAVVCMVLIAVVGIVTGWLLTRRLERLRDAAQRVAAGDLTVRTRLPGQDEVAMLSQSFDQMASRIAADQESLQRANAELERRVEERTAELTRSNAQLKEALDTLQQAKDELIQSEKLAALGKVVAGVAHELNTPIGNSLLVASTFSESTQEIARAVESGLKRSALDKYLESSAKTMELLERNLTRASGLIRSFKQVALDQASNQRRDFELGEIVAENLLMLKPSLKGKQCRIEQQASEPIRMNSFPGPIGQVITNLVNNAVLHAFEGRSSGTVSIRTRQPQPGWVELQVQDDGVGIPAENLRRVFDPFFTTRFGQGGSGLGLNIVHSIVTGMLGGRIEVDSTPGQGCTFTVRLPQTAPAVQDDSALSAAAAS